MSSPEPKKRYEISTIVNFVYELDISEVHQHQANYKKILNEQEEMICKYINESFGNEIFRRWLKRNHRLKDAPPWKILEGNEKVLTSQIDICRTELWDRDAEDKDCPIFSI